MEINTHHKRPMPKVDLTAMVDLGFLLITFFMLTAAFAKPKALEILKPMEGDAAEIPESKTSTILISAGDKVYCYTSPDKVDSFANIEIDSLSYAPSGLRKYIQHRQSEVKATWGNADELFILIKPLPDASLYHVVDVLDEMMITGVKRYAIVEINTAVDSFVIFKN